MNRLRLPLLLVAAVATLAAGCGDGRQPLTVYSPHGSDLLSLVEKAYEAKHPEIDVRWLDMGSQEVYDRIRSEAANPQADVWYGGPQTIFIRGAEDGLLMPYRPAWADAIPAASRNPQNLFFGAYRTAPVLVFNTQAVKPEEAPKDWDDLLDPRWKGKILLRDPLASGTMRTLFGTILSRSMKETGSLDRGWGWLRRFDAQTKEYVQNPALLLEKLNRREGLVTVWELTDMLWQAKRGAPLGYRFATSGTPVIDDSIGMVKNAPHAAQAKAFIDFVGSVEGQELAAREAFRLPARTDLPPERLPQWAKDVLKEMVPADVDWALIAKNGQAWMATWDRTVRGRGASAPKP
ncbi:MAG TPA: extracellular solute-binding protein [Thermoanaerobaculia bacterium]|nr:extracellular solute-binding protein [Thermoanaerobaculia bacterium]